MEMIKSILSTPIELNIYWVIVIAILYIVIHETQHLFSPMRYIDVYMNYIPVLTHEFGHILFNRISGGRAEDLVIVVSPNERSETGQQGFAITRSDSRLSEAITTIGGYMMPPIMLYIGFLAVDYQYPSLFLVAYLLIFLYFLVITSRKLMPILIVIIIGFLIYFLVQNDVSIMISKIVTVLYQFVLGVLLGEVLLSSWIIALLTIRNESDTWDGKALREQTHLPTVLFSLIWIALNLYTVYYMFFV